MADLTPIIETMENRWMRAWVQRDAAALKALTARGFILLTGSKPPAILDNRSWVEAATTRWLCRSYRFGDIYVGEVGGLALFASQMELKASMDGEDWSGTCWVTDLWKAASGAAGGWSSRSSPGSTTRPRSPPGSAHFSCGSRQPALPSGKRPHAAATHPARSRVLLRPDRGKTGVRS